MTYPLLVNKLFVCKVTNYIPNKTVIVIHNIASSHCLLYVYFYEFSIYLSRTKYRQSGGQNVYYSSTMLTAIFIILDPPLLSHKK